MTKTASGLPMSVLRPVPAVVQPALAEWQKHAQKGAAYEDQGEDMKWAACEAYRTANETASLRDIGAEAGKSHVHISYMLKALLTKVNDPQDEWTFADYYASAKGRQPHNTQSNSNEWYTPAAYIASARRVMGGIDLDPASCDMANATVGAATYYTEADNGLGLPWSGRVWLNPPWGREGPSFSARLLDEYAAGEVTQAVVLVNAHSTETDWFAPYFSHVLCFTDHRIDYDSPDGKTSSSTHGSVFVYLGENEDTFAQEFAQWGEVVKRWP